MTTQTLHTQHALFERRRYERVSMNRACKVLQAATHQYMAAQTRDVSQGGALLEIKHRRTLSVGDAVDVLIDWQGQGVLRTAATEPAQVVRVKTISDDTHPESSADNTATVQLVGVAFNQNISLSSAA